MRGALPTYLRIAERLTRDIAAGRLAPGDRLPPERAMAAELGVTVTTLRKALAVLTERGLLERRQGSGNTIRAGDTGQAVYALFRLERPEGGGLPTAELIALDHREKPEGLPDLGSTARHAWNIRRLRALDGVPVAVEDIWLDGRFNGRLTPATVSESLYRSYRDLMGLTIARAEDRLGAGPLPDWAGDRLGARPGTIMALARRRAFAADGRIAEVSSTWFDPDRAAYVARLP
ncbi:GntR family transcriptional regulator [Roseicyclus mahoneyensis]|jgi:GntR family transcriptional regulator|uniref:GntR family transcriptional regulator n=1 Tax=Roseicyclus mahoneyensis TaxID=164332 RepID=A0A316GPZ6_9RHOB|nr:GntR family transcriptional regulator [Roseicyclus mahoneyensis]PWK62481.1 GntR family transcriptional regulator [Roseicyclus mahoneyensis]